MKLSFAWISKGSFWGRSHRTNLTIRVPTAPRPFSGGILKFVCFFKCRRILVKLNPANLVQAPCINIYPKSNRRMVLLFILLSENNFNKNARRACDCRLIFGSWLLDLVVMQIIKNLFRNKCNLSRWMQRSYWHGSMLYNDIPWSF